MGPLTTCSTIRFRCNAEAGRKYEIPNEPTGAAFGSLCCGFDVAVAYLFRIAVAFVFVNLSIKRGLSFY